MAHMGGKCDMVPACNDSSSVVISYLVVVANRCRGIAGVDINTVSAPACNDIAGTGAIHGVVVANKCGDKLMLGVRYALVPACGNPTLGIIW